MFGVLCSMLDVLEHRTLNIEVSHGLTLMPAASAIPSREGCPKGGVGSASREGWTKAGVGHRSGLRLPPLCLRLSDQEEEKFQIGGERGLKGRKRPAQGGAWRRHGTGGGIEFFPVPSYLVSEAPQAKSELAQSRSMIWIKKRRAEATFPIYGVQVVSEWSTPSLMAVSGWEFICI